MFLTFLNVFPTLPTGEPNTIMQSGIEFFEKWIMRTGGLVAFVGAIKFAMATRSEDEKEIMQSIFVMVAGFMICEAVGNLDIFNIPSTYSKAAAEAEFLSITQFIGKWTRRVGALGLMCGSIAFGFAIKDNNATSKVVALKGLTAGAMVMAISAILSIFV